MKQFEQKQELPAPVEQVRLAKPLGKSFFRLLAFVVCIAILVAAFAVSGIWSQFGQPVQTFFEQLFHRDRKPLQTLIPTDDKKEEESPSSFTEEPTTPSKPENAVPIVAKTLFEASELLKTDWTPEQPTLVSNQAPMVLVYCQNPDEAYCQLDQEWLDGDVGELTYSKDHSRTVATVAQNFVNFLNANGIQAIYAEPKIGGVLGASNRAGELLEKMLLAYPQISLVVQIGRDSIFDAEGNYIKTVTEKQEREATAQVLAIVGSEESGLSCPFWRENLTLAKWLEFQCAQTDPALFRGVRIKSSPQNQQFAPHSLSLVVGSGANSVAEASRAMEKVGVVLLDLLKS